MYLLIIDHIYSPFSIFLIVFFFNDTATTEIYTLSLHDPLPILRPRPPGGRTAAAASRVGRCPDTPSSFPDTAPARRRAYSRSEEHTSELQSRQYLVCRLLLEKKNTIKIKKYNRDTINTTCTISK